MLCKYCNEIKALEEMTKDRTRPSGYKDSCKQCYKEREKRRRLENPEKYREAQERYKKREERRVPGLSYVEKRKILDTIKSERGCYFCFEATPICLDFHHRDMSEKEFTVSKHFHRPISVLLAEIEKCEVICSNCHRKLHAGLISF